MHPKLQKNQPEISLARFLHIAKPSPSPRDFVEAIRKGFPIKTMEEIREELGISQQELSEVMGVNVRTLSRRKTSKKLLAPESDRLFRLVSLYVFAVKVLKNRNLAVQWLTTPKTVLGGEIPLRLLDTEAGKREVENLLGRIEYSVYS